MVRPVAVETLRAFCAALFRAAGSSEEEAAVVAAHLVEANLVGHDSHGAIRAPKYLDWVAAGELLANRHAAAVLDAGGLLPMDGGFGYGQVIGRQSMAHAARRARQLGACVLGIRNSGHLGRIGAWAEQLAAAGLVVRFLQSVPDPQVGHRTTSLRVGGPIHAAVGNRQQRSDH